jgi:pimeloyl-ACP methyl ester carboxylesterase
MRYTIADTAKGPIEYRLEGSGPAVVVLNGGHCSRDTRLSHERLSGSGFSVLTPSRPGYDATPSRVGRTAQEAADAVAALLESLGLPRAAVIGISAGGPTALAFAMRHPDRIEKLVLESALTLPWDEPAKRRGRRLFGPARRLTWGATKLALRLFPGWTVRAMMRELTTLDVAEVLARMGPADVAFVRQMIAASRPSEGFLHDLEHRVGDLAAIRCPVLVMYSPHDGPVPPRNAERVGREVAGAELFAAAADSHLIWIGRGADAVWERRLAFLRTGAGRAEPGAAPGGPLEPGTQGS